MAIYHGCLFHELTGLFCPGCGGTRALYAFFRGDFISSFRYHPFVLYSAVSFIYIIYTLIRYLLRKRSKNDGEYQSYQFPYFILWGALLVIGVNFVVKNAALIFWGVDLIN
ncbi:MAG: DUF2752 domain-containing protein [Lachnospiraceae bacterium]|nr:DUF2752 domain-containing protein [Lachnospiraceae bacterium]